MIVASLLLIPVAVLFLALGLINGSSTLLIASIVVSLLAAVALVIGARQATVSRRAARLDKLERPGPMPQAPEYRHETEAADPPDPEPAVADASADDSAFEAAPFAAESPSYEDSDFADQAGATTDSRVTPGGDSPAGADYADSDYADDYASADYEQAASTIGAARDQEPEDPSWRRPAETSPGPQFADASVGQFADAEKGASAGQFADAETRAPSGGQFADADADADADAGSSFGHFADPEAGASAGQFADPEAGADEFAEPDADDPDDEPLPQSVRQPDAALVVRLDTEVLVVDGRPRYHMADCPHLVGRLTEPLPVNEAVELGFNPCGLCRPVDRLVATVSPR